MSHTYVQNLLHVQQRKNGAARDRRDGRPCSFVDPTADDVVIVGCRPGNQDQFVAMDGEELCLATRLCRLQRQRVEQGYRGSLHPHTGYPSQKDGFQIRIDCSLREARRVLRPEICF